MAPQISFSCNIISLCILFHVFWFHLIIFAVHVNSVYISCILYLPHFGYFEDLYIIWHDQRIWLRTKIAQVTEKVETLASVLPMHSSYSIVAGFRLEVGLFWQQLWRLLRVQVYNISLVWLAYLVFHVIHELLIQIYGVASCGLIESCYNNNLYPSVH